MPGWAVKKVLKVLEVLRVLLSLMQRSDKTLKTPSTHFMRALIAYCHDIGEHTCSSYTSTGSITPDHHRIIVVSLSGN